MHSFEEKYFGNHVPTPILELDSMAISRVALLEEEGQEKKDNEEKGRKPVI